MFDYQLLVPMVPPAAFAVSTYSNKYALHFVCNFTHRYWHAEKRLASKVGGHSNLHHLRSLKGLLDPDNMFRNHQLRGLTPLLRKELCGQLLAQAAAAS